MSGVADQRKRLEYRARYELDDGIAERQREGKTEHAGHRAVAMRVLAMYVLVGVSVMMIGHALAQDRAVPVADEVAAAVSTGCSSASAVR